MAGNRFERLLRESRPLLADGGLGTMLIAAGLTRGQAPDGWNADHPGRVEAAQRAYVVAGSDFIHSNTFGGTPMKLRTAGLAGRCRELNLKGVEIARGVAAGVALVAGDVGPTGEMRPPMGRATIEQYGESYAEQVAVLSEAGADLISIETMYDLREALAAVTAAAQTGLPVIASMTFSKRRRGFFTIMGDPLVNSLRALADAGASVVGFNCSVTSPEMVEMVRLVTESFDHPLIAQPNAGQPRPADAGVEYDADPAAFVDDLMSMLDMGVKIVGGCCGTTPGFIRMARQAIDARFTKSP